LAYSSRRPYLDQYRESPGGKRQLSPREIFGIPSRFIREMIGKESQFEKPYNDFNYNQMQLDFPLPDWPSGEIGPAGTSKLRNCLIDCGLLNDCDDIIHCHGTHYCSPVAGVGGAFNTWEVFGSFVSWQPDFLTGIEILIDKDKVEPDGTAIIVACMRDGCGNLCCETVEIQCEKCDETMTIGYTTLGMQINETQTLTALHSDSSKCNKCTWAIASGGGSLNKYTGPEVIYTAPSENENCLDSPIIQLLCDKVVKDQIQIAVNEYVGASPAGRHCCTPSTLPEYHCRNYLYCNGTWLYTETSSTCVSGGCTDYIVNLFYNSCTFSGYQEGGVEDLRTEEMLTAGCCPEALL